jgi:hypothetical protein
LSTCEIDPRYLVALDGAELVSEEDAEGAHERKSPLW